MIQIREGSPLTPEQIRKGPDEATPGSRENVRMPSLVTRGDFYKTKI